MDHIYDISSLRDNNCLIPGSYGPYKYIVWAKEGDFSVKTCGT